MPKHVLCADDSVTMQKVVAITFANSDFAVTQAKNADEALSLARSRKPDLVLADASMPGRSGYDLCQSLKSDPATRHVPVVILCGNSSPYDDVKGRQVGADSFLVKPWDTTTFMEKVNDIIGRAASQGAAQPTRAPSVPAGATVPGGPHVVNRAASPLATAQTKPAIPPAPAPAPAPNPTPTVMGLPRTVPPAAPTPGRTPTGPLATPGALPKPPPGLPRPPLIRGAVPGAVRPGAAMPRVTGPVPSPSPPVVAPTPAATPVVPPPAAATPPAPARPLPPAPPPRAPVIRSATIMGMPAVSTPPAAPTPPAPAPTPTPTPPATVARPPVTVVAPKAQPTPAPVVAPKPAPTPPPVTVSPRPTGPVEAPFAAEPALRGPEYEAIAKLSREIIERIAWEVVPELAEALLKENLSKIQK